MENINESIEVVRKRHGFVTTWLILMIIFNSFGAFNGILAGTGDGSAQDLMLLHHASDGIYLLMGIFSLANVIFSVLLLKWLKIGFYGSVISGVAAFIVNINFGENTGRAFFGLVGILILYGILQIKKDNVSTWSKMD